MKSLASPGRLTSFALLFIGVLGLLSSATLAIEKYKLLTATDYVTSCSINAVLSCESIMKSPVAALFGFPNPYIGIAAFAVVIITGVLAVGGVALPRWYWAGLALGTLAGVVMIHYLIFQALYEINALCPYCMVVWAVTIPLLAIAADLAIPQQVPRAVGLLLDWRWSVVAIWFATVFLMVLENFWTYWKTLI